MSKPEYLKLETLQLKLSFLSCCCESLMWNFSQIISGGDHNLCLLFQEVGLYTYILAKTVYRYIGLHSS